MKYYVAVVSNYEAMFDDETIPKEYAYNSLDEAIEDAGRLVDKLKCCVTIFSEESRHSWKWIIVSPYKDGEEDIIDNPDNHHRFKTFSEVVVYIEECAKDGYNVAIKYDYGEEDGE